MKKALVFGGSNGIGLSITINLSKKYSKVVVFDIAEPKIELPQNIEFVKADFATTDFQFLQGYEDADAVFYSAGIGRIGDFNTFPFAEIDKTFKINTIAPLKVISFFNDRLCSSTPFYFGVMVSIAGRISSPLFSLYSATKAAICKYIEGVNIELEKSGTSNRILEVSPGSLEGTCFSGSSTTDLDKLVEISNQIVRRMEAHDCVFIPQYDSVFKGVIERYQEDAHAFGLQSYEYKKEGGRLNNKSKIRIGYLSGTFDLFHVGHLNLLERAKSQCDYLVVGVHKDASHKGKTTFISFEERKRIVGSIGYVDKVIESMPEDCDVYFSGLVRYDILFVGSDYKGTPRFDRYEELFAPHGVRIVYFPYTKGTSSTQLREALQRH